MGVAEDIRKLAASVPQRKRYVRTEEATKNSLVMPFISALGYDIHDPQEVIPEFNVDVEVKQEAVDYAILKDGKSIILVECKRASDSLNNKKHLSQLIGYYNVTEARFGILTNGVEYRFYTDLSKTNLMDRSPFLTINMLALTDEHVSDICLFAKAAFDERAIWKLVYKREVEEKALKAISKNIAREFASPSRDLVRIFARGVLGKGYQKPSEWERVTNLTKGAIDQFVGRNVPLKVENDVSPPTKKTPTDVVPDYSKYQNWEQLRANPEHHNLYETLRRYVDSLGREVQINPTKYYISFRRKRAAIYFQYRPGKSLMYLFVNADLERISLQEGFTRKLLKSMHYPPCNIEITIRNHDDLRRAMPLIKRSYDEAG